MPMLLQEPTDAQPYSILQGRLDEFECRRKLLQLKYRKTPAATVRKEIRKLEIDLQKINGLIEILEYILLLETTL